MAVLVFIVTLLMLTSLQTSFLKIVKLYSLFLSHLIDMEYGLKFPDESADTLRVSAFYSGGMHSRDCCF